MSKRNETEQAILDAAIKLFGRQGKDGVSIALIADEAQVNRALIFYYFGSKDGLYRAAFLSLAREFANVVGRKMEGIEPGIHLLEQFAREHIAFLRKHPPLVKFIVRELLAADSGGSQLLPEIAEIFGSMKEKMLDALKAGCEKGEIRPVDPLQTMVNILSLDVFFFLGKPMVRLIYENNDLEQFEQEREDHVIDLLLHGLQKREVSP